MTDKQWSSNSHKWGFYDEDEPSENIAPRKRPPSNSSPIPNNEPQGDEEFDHNVYQNSTPIKSTQWPKNNVHQFSSVTNEPQAQTYSANKSYDPKKPTSFKEPNILKPNASRLGYSEACKAASAVIADLNWQSRFYSGISWSVGILVDSRNLSFLATSNEGMGFLPPGVQWDTGLTPVFGLTLMETERGIWMGLENPARILIDHYLRLHTHKPDLRLLGVSSTQPMGRAVLDFLSLNNIDAIAPAEDSSGYEFNLLTRSEANIPKHILDLIPLISPRQLWAAALELTIDAAQHCDLYKTDRYLLTYLDALQRGMTLSTSTTDQISTQSLNYASIAKSARVQDDKLGAIDTSFANPTLDTIIEISAGSNYSEPFFASRLGFMIQQLFNFKINDTPLSNHDLSNFVYEHYIITNQVTLAETILHRHVPEHYVQDV